MDGFVSIKEVLGAAVYALVLDGVVVYIGQSRSALTRIYTHRQAWRSHVSGRKPLPWLKVKPMKFDDVHIRPCPIADLDRVERELIARYQPKHNIVHKEGKITVPIPLNIGGIAITLNAPPVVIPRRVIFERRV